MSVQDLPWLGAIATDEEAVSILFKYLGGVGERMVWREGLREVTVEDSPRRVTRIRIPKMLLDQSSLSGSLVEILRRYGDEKLEESQRKGWLDLYEEAINQVSLGQAYTPGARSPGIP